MQKLFRTPAIQLGEFDFSPTAEISSEIQLLRSGAFDHPMYGSFEVRRADINTMVKNFNEKVRKIDIAVDFAHESEKEAAGWIQSLSAKELDLGGTELWATVKWTTAGKQALIDRHYRYMSADFSYEYVDNETKQEFGPTLFGAGLTNRPFVKGMAPVIELSEGKGTEMEDKKKIEQLTAQVGDLLKAKEESDAKLSELTTKLSEQEASSKKAAEDKAEAERKLAEKEKSDKFNLMLKDGKACEAQREAFMLGNLEEFAKLAQPVKLSTEGTETAPAEGPKTFEQVQAEVMKLAEELVKKDGKLPLHKALSAVLAERQDLAKIYNQVEGE